MLEDTVRFLGRRPAGYEEFRSLRHALDKTARALRPALVRSRDSEEDAGKSSALGRYPSRGSLAAANFKRCQEALRVLEEYGRLFPGKSAAGFKTMRFKLYVLEKKFLTK